MLCLCTHSLSLRAGIADSHDYAGLHTPGFCLRKVLIASLLLKMNKWVLLRFESGSNLDSSCKICACSRCPTCELFRSEPGLVRGLGHSFQHLHSSAQQVQSGFPVKVAQDHRCSFNLATVVRFTCCKRSSKLPQLLPGYPSFPPPAVNCGKSSGEHKQVLVV
jgi:hypothetical protein